MRKANPSRGFTLIEVIIAVVILAGSLTILISMVTTSVASAVNDRQHFYASLAARSLMSAIELQGKIDTQDTVKPLIDLLEQFNAVNQLEPELRRVYEQMEAALIVQDFEIPGLLPPSGDDPQQQQESIVKLKKLSLGVRWGGGDEQHLDIYFALPAEP